MNKYKAFIIIIFYYDDCVCNIKQVLINEKNKNLLI